MGDPVTMAVIGGGLGAMMNEKDPLKGALLGAAGGYGGATLMGAGGAGLTPGIVPSSSVLSGSTTINAAAPMVGQGFVNSVPTAITTGPSGAIGVEAAKGGLFGGATPLTNTAMQGQGLAQTSAIQRPLSLGMTGVEPGQGYEYTLGDRFGQVGQYAQQNPVLTNQALGYAKQAMQQPPEQPLAPGQINRSQIQSGDYASLLNPQQDTVLRPQRISLLG